MKKEAQDYYNLSDSSVDERDDKKVSKNEKDKTLGRV